MNKKILPFPSLIILVVLTFAYLISKYVSPFLNEFLYNNNIELLNTWFKVSNPKPLTFFQGMLEDVFWGPLQMLFSGLFFLLFAWHFLLKSSGKKFGLALFGYFLVTKLDILFFPPYGDTIGGAWAEAIWLANHSFDYAGLYQQPVFVHGGPKTYFYTLYPTYLAILMKLFPNTKIFLIVNHLIVFIWGAILLTYFRKTVQQIYDEKISLLLTFVVMSMPLFHTQVEAVTMEMPMVLFAMLSIYFLTIKKLWRASIFSMLAAFTKGVGVCVGATVFVIALFLYFYDKDLKQKASVLLAGIAAIIFAYLEIKLSFLALLTGSKADQLGLLQGLNWVKAMPVTYLCLISVGIFVVQCLKSFKVINVKNIVEFLKKNYVSFVFIVYVVIWFMSFLQSLGDLVRYRLLLLPFSTFCIFYAIHCFIKSPIMLYRLSVGFIILALLGSYGFFYPSHKKNIHGILERSLEYRNDLKLDLELGRILEEAPSDFTIVAPFTMAQLLALPEVGYVSKKLNVMIYGMDCTYGGIQNFRGIDKLNLKKTIFAAWESELPDNIEFPVGRNDKVISEIWVGNRRARLFIGGFAIESVYRMKMMMEQKNFMRMHMKNNQFNLK